MNYRQRPRAFSLAEVLVATGLSLLCILILARTMSNLNKAKVVQDEVSAQARSLRTLDSKLRNITGSASAESVHLSSNGQILCIQSITQLSTDGEQQWSPKASIATYNPGTKLFTIKAVPFASAGVASTSVAPVTLTEDNIIALNNADGEPLAEYSRITATEFSINRDQASLGVKMRREVLYSQKHKDELWLESGYSLRSSLALSASQQLTPK